MPGRRVAPDRVVQAGSRWYLVALDLERDDWRPFRADRIESPRLTGIRFEPRDPPDAAAFVANAVTTAPYRYQAKVLVQAPASEVAARVPPTTVVVAAISADSCLLTTGSDSLDSLAFHIAMLGFDVAVLQPPQLAERR